MPSQAFSLKLLSSMPPTSLTMHALMVASLGALASGSSDSGAIDSAPIDSGAALGAALSPPPVQAARINIRMARKATGMLKLFRMKSPSHRFGCVQPLGGGASVALRGHGHLALNLRHHTSSLVAGSRAFRHGPIGSTRRVS